MSERTPPLNFNTVKYDALIGSYEYHLRTDRVQDPEAIHEEIERLRRVQRYLVERAA